jgi:PAS domain S-box-containing protein
MAKRTPEWLLYSFVVAFLVVLMVSLIALEAWQEKLRYRERATVATRNIAGLLDNHLSGVADKVDVVLQAVIAYYEDQTAHGRLNGARLTAQLQRHETLLPEVTSLRIVDKDGYVRYGSGITAANPVSLADREFYLRARDNPESALIVSGPVFARLSQQWVLVFARRLNAPDGSFAGVVYANLATAYFDKVLSSLTLGQYGAATIRMSDLSLVHRFPQTHGQVGSKNVSQELREMVRTQPERGEAATALDGIERSNAYRKLERYPFYVIVGLATEDYLGAWQANVYMLSGLAGLAIVLIGFAAMLVYRSNRRLLTDISERKRTEERLRKSEERFRKTAESVSSFIWEVDLNGLYTYVSPLVESVLGYAPEELVGKKHFYDLFDPVVRGGLKAAAFQVFAVGETLRDFPHANVSKDGRLVHLETSGTALLDPAGKLIGYLGADTDVTKRKQMSLDLEMQRNELAHLSRVTMLSGLSGSLAHELNQPLMAILSNAQAALWFMAGDKPDLTEIREILQDIVNDDKRAGEVIQGLRQMLKKDLIRYEALNVN